MITSIDQEPDDTLGIKIIKIEQLLRKGAWNDPPAFRKRFLDPFRAQLERGLGHSAFKIEAYGFNSIDPQIALIARPVDAPPLE